MATHLNYEIHIRDKASNESFRQTRSYQYNDHRDGDLIQHPETLNSVLKAKFLKEFPQFNNESFDVKVMYTGETTDGFQE